MAYHEENAALVGDIFTHCRATCLLELLMRILKVGTGNGRKVNNTYSQHHSSFGALSHVTVISMPY